MSEFADQEIIQEYRQEGDRSPVDNSSNCAGQPLGNPLAQAEIKLEQAAIKPPSNSLLNSLWVMQPKGWRAWLWIGLFALVDGTLFQGFLAEGLQRTGAGLGSVMIDSQPIAIALMSAWLFKEIIGVWGWLGLSLGVIGISFIGLPQELWLGIFQGSAMTINFSWQGLFNNGEWLMLLASLSMAVGTILMPYVSRYSDPVIATGWHMILGGLPLFALSGIYETHQWVNLQGSDAFALGYSTIFGSAIAYGLFFYFAAHGNLTSLSSLTFLTPVFALLFSSLLLGEVLAPLQWTGVSLTIVSIYLINQRETLANKFSTLVSKPPASLGKSSLETIETIAAMPNLESENLERLEKLEILENPETLQSLSQLSERLKS
ncbi:MAG: DMT family transporter [Coleofasciculaceae cyanobacterium SM2_1_6]|nr:DMT family transporter [Coleofasciculaceae cyanobacterium SM2_1_6]